MPSPKVPKPKNTSRVSHRAESVSLHYIRLLLLCSVLKEGGWPVHVIVQSVYIFVSIVCTFSSRAVLIEEHLSHACIGSIYPPKHFTDCFPLAPGGHNNVGLWLIQMSEMFWYLYHLNFNTQQFTWLFSCEDSFLFKSSSKQKCLSVSQPRKPFVCLDTTLFLSLSLPVQLRKGSLLRKTHFIVL